MKKLIPSLFIALALASCGSKSEQSNNSTEEYGVESVANYEERPVPFTAYDYSVLDQEVSNLVQDGQTIKKIHYTVEIPAEYSKDVLDEIADVIKSGETLPYVFIEFYLSGQPRTGTNYGIAKRTPTENTTEINYIAPPTEPVQPIKKPYDGCKVYGAWSMPGATVIAYQKNGKCYMVNYYGDSNFDDPERYIKTTFRGRTAFKNAEDPSDMYVINSNGDLDGYSGGDLCTTFPQTTY